PRGWADSGSPSAVMQLGPFAQQMLLVAILDMAERLTDEVDANHLFPCPHEFQRDRPRDRRTDGGAVEAFHRDDARAGAGGKSLVGAIDVVGREVGFYDGDSHLVREGKERRAGHAAE